MFTMMMMTIGRLRQDGQCCRRTKTKTNWTKTAHPHIQVHPSFVLTHTHRWSIVNQKRETGWWYLELPRWRRALYMGNTTGDDWRQNINGGEKRESARVTLYLSLNAPVHSLSPQGLRSRIMASFSRLNRLKIPVPESPTLRTAVTE